MAATTIYDLQIKIALQGMQAAKSAAAALGSSLKGIGGALRDIGFAANGLSAMGGIFGRARDALIGFNSQVEQSRIGLQTMVGLNLGKTFASAQVDADGFFKAMQQAAKTSPGTTADFIAMGQGIAPSLLAAGHNMKDLERFTVGEPGDGTSSDATTEIVPVPLVVRDVRRRQEPQGVEQVGLVEVREISRNYLAAEIRPALTASQELLYKFVEAHGEGKPDEWYVLAADPWEDAEKSIGWVLPLRRAEG